ncbi:MAG: DUF1579 family protein [Planctomycetota bacterium]
MFKSSTNSSTMKHGRTGLTIILAAVAGIAFVAGRASGPDALGSSALAQEGNRGAQEGNQPAMDPSMFGRAKQHDHLDLMLGTWEGTMRFRMTPDEEWTDFPGTVTREWIMDGMFVAEHVKATVMGMDFEGMGAIGYNSYTNSFESVWIENLSPAISTAKGTYDAASKTWTFEGSMHEAGTGKLVPHKWVHDASDPQKHTVSGYAKDEDGQWWHSMSGELTKTSG